MVTAFFFSTSGSDSEDDEFSWKTKKVSSHCTKLYQCFVTSTKGFQKKKEDNKRFTKE